MSAAGGAGAADTVEMSVGGGAGSDERDEAIITAVQDAANDDADEQAALPLRV